MPAKPMHGSLCIALVSTLLVLSCQQGTRPSVATETQEPLTVRTETQTVTSTVSPARSPTMTSTPQPPLVEHEWEPEQALMLFRFTAGDGGGIIAQSAPPRFILYADGGLFVTRSTEDDSRQQLFFKKLTREEICQNLNTLDQIGFLDYDPSTYEFVGDGPMMMGAPGVYMEVNSWKSHKSHYYELGLFIPDKLTGRTPAELRMQDPGENMEYSSPVISPALQTAYYFFTEYSVQGFEIYQPERLAVWLVPLKSMTDEAATAREWTLTNLSLDQLSAQVDIMDDEFLNDTIILKGKDASLAFNEFDRSFSLDGRYYFQTSPDGEKEYYLVYARPLLPYEVQTSPETYEIMDSPKPDFKLKCYPSDGVVPPPTPSIP